MGQFGINNGAMDTLVLGCTHYPFAVDTLRPLVGEHVVFLEGGAPVARQTHRLLADRGWLAQAPVEATRIEPPVFCTTGNGNNLLQAVHRWLNLTTDVQTLVIESSYQPASSIS